MSYADNVEYFRKLHRIQKQLQTSADDAPSSMIHADVLSTLKKKIERFEEGLHMEYRENVSDVIDREVVPMFIQKPITHVDANCIIEKNDGRKLWRQKEFQVHNDEIRGFSTDLKQFQTCTSDVNVEFIIRVQINMATHETLREYIITHDAPMHIAGDLDSQLIYVDMDYYPWSQADDLFEAKIARITNLDQNVVPETLDPLDIDAKCFSKDERIYCDLYTHIRLPNIDTLFTEKKGQRTIDEFVSIIDTEW